MTRQGLPGLTPEAVASRQPVWAAPIVTLVIAAGDLRVGGALAERVCRVLAISRHQYLETFAPRTLCPRGWDLRAARAAARAIVAAPGARIAMLGRRTALAFGLDGPVWDVAPKRLCGPRGPTRPCVVLPHPRSLGRGPLAGRMIHRLRGCEIDDPSAWVATHALYDHDSEVPYDELLMNRGDRYYTQESWCRGGRSETVESFAAAGLIPRCLT